MGELMVFSESSLLQLPHTPLCTSRRGHLPVDWRQASLAVTSPMCFSSTRLMMFPTFLAEEKQCSWRTRVSIVSDSMVPTTCNVDSSGEDIDILPESDDNFGGVAILVEGVVEAAMMVIMIRMERNGMEVKIKVEAIGRRACQCYAALVGIGGVTGYLKGGSQKSLIAGGLSASLLYYVYILLPSNSVLASSLGLCVSASLLGLMGCRFMKWGKIFAAGIVSFASLVMTDGYLYGILHSLR